MAEADDAIEPEPIKQLRQDRFRFVEKVAAGTQPAERGGGAAARPRVDEDIAPEPLPDVRREVLPGGDRAEAMVQEHDRLPRSTRVPHDLVLEGVALNSFSGHAHPLTAR